MRAVSVKSVSGRLTGVALAAARFHTSFGETFWKLSGRILNKRRWSACYPSW